MGVITIAGITSKNMFSCSSILESGVITERISYFAALV